MVATTVKSQGIEIEVSRITPRVRMFKGGYIAVAQLVQEELVEEFSMSTRSSVITALGDFIEFSSRIKIVKGKFDFEFPLPNASPKSFMDSFREFLDTDFDYTIRKVIDIINDIDSPDDDELDTGKKKP